MKVKRSSSSEVDEHTKEEKFVQSTTMKGQGGGVRFQIKIEHDGSVDDRFAVEHFAKAGRKLERGKQLDGLDDIPCTITTEDGTRIETSTGEVNRVADDLKDRSERDSAFRQACNVAVTEGGVAVKLLQDKLGGISKERARRILKQLEYEEVVAEFIGDAALWDSHPRDVLMDQSQVDALFSEAAA
jgi:hypothetical protein